MNVNSILERLGREQGGQTFVEYALILALVSGAATLIVGVGLVGSGLQPFFTTVTTFLAGL